MNTKPVKKRADGKNASGTKSRAAIALASMMVAACICVIASVAAPPPPVPFLISGYVFNEDGSGCNHPCVNITNLNTSREWQAETNASCNDYQLILATGVNINASEILRFNATSSDGNQNQSKVFDHIVNGTEVDEGGLFNITITLESSPLWDPWIYDTNGDGVIDKSEAIDAVQDYFDDKITKEQALDVIQLYFG